MNSNKSGRASSVVCLCSAWSSISEIIEPLATVGELHFYSSFSAGYTMRANRNYPSIFRKWSYSGAKQCLSQKQQRRDLLLTRRPLNVTRDISWP